MAIFDKRNEDKRSSPLPPSTVTPTVSASAPPTQVADKASMIGKGIRISGDVKAEVNLRIDGVVEGHDVSSAEDVEISEPGKVIGNVSARVIRIAGEVTGDITGSEKVVISKTGRVQGNIMAPRVQLEDGALFRGSIDMTPVSTADDRPDARPAANKAAVMEASARKEPGLTLKSG